MRQTATSRSPSSSKTSELELPHRWEPRPYQVKAWRALTHGTKRAALVWHRRAGKDLLLLNFTIAQAAQRIGVYWHVLPTAKQGRKILWDGVTKDGRPFLDHWPRSLIASRNESEMKIKTRDGAVWQIVGSDNYTEALIGGNVIVFPPYDLQGIFCQGRVTAAGTLRIRLRNGTAGTIDLAGSAAWEVWVIKGGQG